MVYTCISWHLNTNQEVTYFLYVMYCKGDYDKWQNFSQQKYLFTQWKSLIISIPDTSSDGLQRANIVRQNLKSAESSEIKSKRKPRQTKTATLQLSDDINSPPMSLSGKLNECVCDGV